MVIQVVLNLLIVFVLVVFAAGAFFSVGYLIGVAKERKRQRGDYWGQ